MCPESLFSKHPFYEPHFIMQDRHVKNIFLFNMHSSILMLELPKRDLKELPGWAMHVLRVLHREGIRSWISNLEHGSASAALKLELREGAATALKNPESKTKFKRSRNSLRFGRFAGYSSHVNSKIGLIWDGTKDGVIIKTILLFNQYSISKKIINSILKSLLPDGAGCLHIIKLLKHCSLTPHVPFHRFTGPPYRLFKMLLESYCTCR